MTEDHCLACFLSQTTPSTKIYYFWNRSVLIFYEMLTFRCSSCQNSEKAVILLTTAAKLQRFFKKNSFQTCFLLKEIKLKISIKNLGLSGSIVDVKEAVEELWHTPSEC
ncbi:hypothetical protein ABEB36_005396 [Hypothenemus hampei]|uniref:Uncharacterized protein n=1 Tax=Hypothenemus hampei TaxID=57062 RepID=A0ABD1EY83_HYPHA